MVEAISHLTMAKVEVGDLGAVQVGTEAVEQEPQDREIMEEQLHIKVALIQQVAVAALEQWEVTLGQPQAVMAG